MLAALRETDHADLAEAEFQLAEALHYSGQPATEHYRRAVVELVELGERFWALVLAPADNEPGVVDLGPSTPIHAAAIAARVALEGPGRAFALRNLIPPNSGQREADAPAALARLVVEPLLPRLGACRRIWLTVDGPLLHIPFGMLPVGASGRPWLAELAIGYVTALDDLARDRPAPGERGPDIVLAAPDYDLAHPGPRTSPIRFDPLPGTADESARILRRRPGTVPLVGANALKALLRIARSPRTLHLATHGYTLAEVEPAAMAEAARRLRPNQRQLGRRWWNLRRHRDHRAGLALAGANTWLDHGEPGEYAQTGLLTVADIAGLDLVGTELVVLSACDTGIGEPDGVGGHASLRAAFLRSGARAVIASLWKVPDRETGELMDRMYELLGEGHPPASALRTAQLERYATAEPVLFWGAFVCYGW